MKATYWRARYWLYRGWLHTRLWTNAGHMTRLRELHALGWPDHATNDDPDDDLPW